MHVIQIINQTSDYWTLPRKTQFHHIIAQYVTKMVKFEQSRIIRANLYTLLGDPYSQEKFNICTDSDLMNCRLSDGQITTLRYISSLVNEDDTLDNNLQRLSKVSGIGPWTIKSIRLMLTDDNSIFLYEDYYIRCRLAELYGISKITIPHARTIGLCWGNYQSLLSKFLWRIKPGGILKIMLGETLCRDDFL